MGKVADQIYLGWRRLLVTVLAAAIMLGGCTAVEEPELTLPRAFSSIDVPGQVQSIPEHATSPDGRHILASMTDNDGAHVILLRMNANETALTKIESVGSNWLKQAFFSYRPIGWMSETQFLYAKVGWQPSGIKKDQRSVVLVVGDSSNGSFEEVASVPLPSGGTEILYVPDRSKAFISLKTSIWEFDTVHRNLRLVKDGLPDNPYLNPVPSPSGEYYVYAREEADTRGLYILDTATGEERVLTAYGETRSFYPSWSFDGKYVAAYTAERKPGSTGTTWRDYDIIEGEDTAQSVGQRITVFDAQGSTISSAKVEGKRLASFRWADNSDSIAFLTGTRLPSDAIPAISNEGLWVATIGPGQVVPKMLAPISESESGMSPWAYPVAFDAAGEGVYYDLYENGTWYAREGSEPVRVAEGSWTPLTADETRPIYWGGVLALVDELGPKVGLYLMAGGEAVKFAEYPRATVLAYAGWTLVIFAGEPVPPYPGSGQVIAYTVTRQ